MNEDYIISEIDKRIHTKDIRSFKTVQIKKAMLKNSLQDLQEFILLLYA